MLGLRNGQPLFRRETVIMLCIGSAGFVSNYYGGKLIVYTTAFETDRKSVV